MTTKYRINWTNGGWAESYDLEEAKQMRASSSQGGTIVAIEQTYTVHNAPELGVFQMPEDADMAVQNMMDENYYKVVSEVIVDPQPEGLND